MSAQAALRVLLVEDVDTDAELNARELRLAGLQIEARRVETREEFLAALETFRPELVLCDHSMPGFGAPMVLPLLRERAPDLPVIVVTGSLDEETAVEAMKAGAWDYVLKERLTRLGPAVGRALAHARTKREGQQAAARLRAIVDTALDGIVTIDEAGLVESFNPAAERLFGYAAEEVLGRNVSLLMPAPYREGHDGHVRRYTSTGERTVPWGGPAVLWDRRQLTGKRKDGTEFPLQVSLAEFRIGERRAFSGLIRDLSEEHRLRRSLEMTQFAMDGSTDLVIWVNADGRLVYANESAARSLGYAREELLGLSLWDLSSSVRREDWPATWSAVSRAGSARTEDAIRRKDGSTLPAEVVVTAVRVDSMEVHCAIVRDISERRLAETRQAATEEMLRQSQKLEAVGRLAGGVAHDFNNLLGVIVGYAELMRIQMSEDHPARRRLEHVLKAAERAAALTRQLLAFSRKQVMQPALLDLGAAVRNLRTMLDRVLGEDVEIEVRAAHGLGTVRVDPTQVDQVLMNLVVNARDAMPRGGHLTIETANAEFDEAYAASHPPAQAGRYVMLAVSDNGSGMDAETQRHIFEPFFTTKPPGEGTGLGLAMVYGVVKQSGGYVWVYSEPGQGTTFKLYLPRVDGPLDTETAEPRSAPEVPGGHETVLVVEDREDLREVIREALEERGYGVLVAGDGEQALALMATRTHPIGLLLTDVVMPKMSGAELAYSAAELQPGIRVLYMSGYSNGAVSRQGVLAPGAMLIEKPFTGDRLARAVREAIDPGMP